MNILSLSDYSSFSGFGCVAKGILTNLPSTWQIKHLGINFQPHHEAGNLPDNINVFDARNGRDIYGRKRFIKMLRYGDFDYDIVWILQDSFVLSADIQFEDKALPFIEVVKILAHKNDAKVVTYTPMDQPHPFVADWFDPLLEHSDELVYYLDWARDNADYYSKMDHSKANVIHHGVDCNTYHPLGKEETQEAKSELGLDNGKFTILFGGANQRRKNIPHDVIGVFVELYKHVGDDVHLALKTQIDKEQGDGWDLGKVLGQVQQEEDIPEGAIQFIGQGQFLPEETMNDIVNAVDAVYVPSCEGWGMFATEAMAAKTPTIVGNHAALSEIGDYGRSIQVKTSDTLEDRVYHQKDKNVWRSQIVFDSFVDQAKNLMEMDEEDLDKMLDRAYTSDYTKPWKSVANEWRELIERAANG